MQELFLRAEKTDRPNPENKDLSILIIEDDAVNQLFLETILSKRNYSLEIAPDGEEAIELVSALKPDLVLLDIGLPGKSGLDVAEYMKKNQELKDIPIICITAFRERDIIASLSALRVNKILIKPVNTEKIYAAIDYMF